MKKITITLASICFLLNLPIAHAWVEPKPGENISAPINTSSQEQTKKGILNFNNWVKIFTNPFNFDVGVEAPKFCIKKPDGTTSCCPPEAGQDWSACASGGGGVNTDAKWVWNATSKLQYLPSHLFASKGSYDLVVTEPSGSTMSINNICFCYYDKTHRYYKEAKKRCEKKDGYCPLDEYLGGSENRDYFILPNFNSNVFFLNEVKGSCSNTCQFNYYTGS